MPIVATFPKQTLTQSATAEGLTAAQAKTALASAPAGWLPTLVNRANDPVSAGDSLAVWRTGFPAILNHDDATDSFLIRVAVMAAGGIAV